MTTDDHQYSTQASRVRFDFRGPLDELAPAVGVATSTLARALLRHADLHDGRQATMRLDYHPPRLDVTLADPECSPACLASSPSAGLHGDRLVLDAGEGGGLRVRWAVSETSFSGRGRRVRPLHPILWWRARFPHQDAGHPL